MKQVRGWLGWILLALFTSSCGIVLLDSGASDGPDGQVREDDSPFVDSGADEGSIEDEGIDAADRGTDNSLADRGVDTGASDRGAMDAGDSGAGFNSDVNTCTSAESGPFVEVGSVVPRDTTLGLWFRAPFLVAAETFGGLVSYRFDGATFEEIDREEDIWFSEGIYADGDTFVVGSPGRGLYRIRMDGAGALTREHLLEGPVVEARRPWGDGTRTYVPNGADGIVTLEWTGDRYDEVNVLDTPGFAQGAYAVGDNVWLADNTNISLFRFIEPMDELILADRVMFAGASRVWVTDESVFVGGDGLVGVWDPADALGTRRADAPLSARARDVWSDGATVFVAASTGGLYAFRREGPTTLVELDQVDVSANAFAVVGDGEYVFVADGDAAIRAYTGFRCTTRR